MERIDMPKFKAVMLIVLLVIPISLLNGIVLIPILGALGGILGIILWVYLGTKIWKSTKHVV